MANGTPPIPSTPPTPSQAAIQAAIEQDLQARRQIEAQQRALQEQAARQQRGGLLGGAAVGGLADEGLDLVEQILPSSNFGFAPAAGPFGGLGADVPVASTVFEGGPGILTASGETVAAPAAGGIGLGGLAAGVGGALGAADLLQRRDVSTGRGLAQGAASGAGIGFAFGGPAGAGIGAGIGAAVGLAKSIFGDEPTSHLNEFERRKKLNKQGLLPNELVGKPPSGPLQPEQLKAREEAKLARGEHGNPKFAISRDEADLTPKDVWAGAMHWELLGKDYLDKSTEPQRFEYNRRLLEEGLIKESRGELNLLDEERAQAIWTEVTGQPAPPIPGQQTTEETAQEFEGVERPNPSNIAALAALPRPQNQTFDIKDSPAQLAALQQEVQSALPDATSQLAGSIAPLPKQLPQGRTVQDAAKNFRSVSFDESLEEIFAGG